MKKLWIITVVVAVALIAALWSAAFLKPYENKRSEPSLLSGKATVAASFYPLAEFARQVGGDRISEVTIVPPGSEPHDYEPSPRDIIAVREAQLFLFNGAGLDPWAETLRGDLEKSGTRVIEMAEHVELLPGESSEDEHGDGHTDEHETEADRDGEERVNETEEHEHGAFDPHFWLDPVRAATEVELIRDGLMAIDPAGKKQYEKNASAYIAQLKQIDMAYRTGLQSCRLKTVVVSHESFRYLADRYGLKTLSITGLSPEAEPSLQHLAELSDTVKKENIRFIFFETLVSPKLAETLARETGTQTLVFNPLEGLTEEEIAEGKNYLTVMRENLANLRTALECK